MLRFSEFLVESKKKRPLHVFEDGEMTFGDIRNLMEDLFQTDIATISPKKPYASIAVTCKDGKACGCWNQDDPSQPKPLSKFSSEYTGDKDYKQPFQMLLDAVEKKLSELEIEDQKDIFNDGHRFMKLNVYVPDNLKQCQDCGNTMIGGLNGVTNYDDKFENETPLTEADDEISQRVISIFAIPTNEKTAKTQNVDPLARSAYALKENAIEAFKNCPSREQALNEVSTMLTELIDGLGYRATLNDYIKERYEKKIMNAATKAGLNIHRSSDFVSEMVDRLSTMTSRRPTMADLSTYAKREGVNVNSDEYKNFLELMDSTLDADNYEMLKPISVLLNKIFVMFLRSLLGYATMEDEKLANQITVALDALEGCGEMTEANMAILKKLFANLKVFAKQHENGDKYTFTKDGTPYSLKCRMPDVESFGNRLMRM